MAQAISSPIQFSDFRIYKSFGSSEPRTLPVYIKPRTLVVGSLQHKILLYLIEYNLVEFQPMELVVALGVDKRRVSDALKRLVNRGIVAKTKRGRYILNRELATVILSRLKQRKKSKRRAKDSDAHRGVHCGSHCGVHRGVWVVRVHGRVRGFGSWVDYLRDLLRVRMVIDFAIRYTVNRLLSMGVSRNEIRRVRRDVRSEMELFLRSATVRAGVHGVGRYRASGGERAITFNFGSMEIGLDIVGCCRISGFYVKVYRASEKKVLKRPLIDV